MRASLTSSIAKFTIAWLFVTVVSASGRQIASSTEADRLDRLLEGARTEISRSSSLRPEAQTRLHRELDEVRDDSRDVRESLRRGDRVDPREIRRIEDRIETIRAQTRGPDAQLPPARDGEIPSGAELDVRLQTPLNSDVAKVEDRVEAVTIVDLVQNGRAVVPAGARLRGVVTSVDRASRTDRKGSLTVHFDELIVAGRTFEIDAIVTDALESEGLKGEVGRIGVGATIGGIIGGILGGVKGAVAGIMIGGGGVIAATEGKDVDLPAGTILRVRFQSPTFVGTE